MQRFWEFWVSIKVKQGQKSQDNNMNMWRLMRRLGVAPMAAADGGWRRHSRFIVVFCERKGIVTHLIKLLAGVFSSCTLDVAHPLLQLHAADVGER
jgi:hypothetical protein